MTQAIETSKTFQEKMFERIRDQIGDLMTDEDLKKMVDAALHKAFFEEQKVRDGYHDRIIPAPIVPFVSSLVQMRINTLCNEYVKDNEEKINIVIKEIINKGFVSAVSDYFDNKLRSSVNEFSNQIQTSLKCL